MSLLQQPARHAPWATSMSESMGGIISECPGDFVGIRIPLLGLFTGARRGELAVLTAADVQHDAVAEKWAIALRKDLEKGKRLKTISSARTVPLHPQLVRMGFLDYVKSVSRKDKEAWLFAAVSTKEGVKAWSKWFRRYLDSFGITDNRKGLHSLRHNFTDALREAGAHEGLIDALSGRIVQTVGRSYGARATHAGQRHKVNIKRFGMVQLAETVAKVNYPNLDLAGIHWKPGTTKLAIRAKRKSRTTRHKID